MITKKLIRHNNLAKKLSFESGTGDAPDDWYVVYADKATNLIEKLHIVTKMSEEAEKKPACHTISGLQEN
jgi:hypothetical protein